MPIGNNNTPPTIIVSDPLITGIDPAQVAAQQGGISIGIAGPDGAPLGPRLAHSGPGRAWHHGLGWKHAAMLIGVGLVVWWILSGEDPITTVADVAKTSAKAVEGAASAVVG